MSDQTEVNGSCLCGAVRMAIKPTSTSVGACHCSMCRKWGGGPLLAVECESDVQIDGADNVSVFSSSEWAERAFCSRCGSHLFYRLKKGGLYAVPVGLLEDGGQWVFDHQLFVDEQPAFYAFANETKQLTGAEIFAQFAAPAR